MSTLINADIRGEVEQLPGQGIDASVEMGDIMLGGPPR
jgi:hypothetical protein